jgi:hypothetical protein
VLWIMLPAAVSVALPVRNVVRAVGVVYECIVVIDVDIVVAAAPVVVVTPAPAPGRTHRHPDTK